MDIKKTVFGFVLAVLWSGNFLYAETPAGPSPSETAKIMTQEFQRHNYKKVIQVYRSAYGDPAPPAPIPLQILYSQALADTGDLEESIRVLKELLKDWTPEMDAVALHYNLANLLVMEKRQDEARAAYQKVLSFGAKHGEMLAKARERTAVSKESGNRKKDVLSLQMIDIETSLEAGEVPEGSGSILRKIVDENSGTAQAERAARLLERIKEIRENKARALLDEARRLFDQERKYAEVRQILEEIHRDYPDVAEIQSVEALLKQVNLREGRR